MKSAHSSSVMRLSDGGFVSFLSALCAKRFMVRFRSPCRTSCTSTGCLRATLGSAPRSLWHLCSFSEVHTQAVALQCQAPAEAFRGTFGMLERLLQGFARFFDLRLPGLGHHHALRCRRFDSPRRVGLFARRPPNHALKPTRGSRPGLPLRILVLSYRWPRGLAWVVRRDQYGL